MTDALKPCPFCGAAPLLYDLLDTHGGFSIECPTDGCDTEKLKRTKAGAVAAWNNRAAPAAPAVLPGWQLVPVEPTEAMASAFDDAHHRADFRHESYAAMLAAAPTAQPTRAEGE